MSRIIGDAQPDEEALKGMRESEYNFPDTRWAAYQNRELGHYEQGWLRFLAVGPRNTAKVAPQIYPDTHLGLGWRYVFVGYVDLTTGRIVEEP